MDYGKKERADALAAQYVAGTLRGAARRRFEALLPAHPALRAAVLVWRARLMPLTGVMAPVAPPDSVWAGIERRLWPQAVAAPAAAPTTGWRGLAFWRLASGLATVSALGLALLLVQPRDGAPPVVLVLQATEAGAVVGGTAGRSSFVASVNADGGALVTRPLQPVALTASQVFELWAVPPEGAPRSLGLISADGVTVIRRDRLPATLLDTARTAALAVSVEPPGGSPTGAPTGPVVFAGKLQL